MLRGRASRRAVGVHTTCVHEILVIPIGREGEDLHMRSLILAMTLTLLACGGDDDIDVLSCTGECTCDEDTNTCSCLGGTECNVESDGAVNLVCEGNARCDLACGDSCNVDCPGTSGCDAAMGANSMGTCNGTASCGFTCSGDCTIDCPGASSCTLACPEGATCTITSCPMVTSCGNGVQACRTACPS
jgi:hypothetical protein